MYYNEKLDEYFMWHTNIEYTRENRNFIEKLDEIILKKLIENEVFNFSFGFDYSEYQKEQNNKNFKLNDYKNDEKRFVLENKINNYLEKIALAS